MSIHCIRQVLTRCSLQILIALSLGTEYSFLFFAEELQILTALLLVSNKWITNPQAKGSRQGPLP